MSSNWTFLSRSAVSRRALEASPQSTLIPALLYLLLLVQLGLNTTASVATLGLVVLIWEVRAHWTRGVLASMSVVLILGFSVLWTLLTAPDTQISAAREARLILGLGLIAFLAGKEVPVRREQVERAVLTSLFLLLMLVIAQRWGVGGFRWFLPTEIYAISTDGALASDEIRKAVLGGYSIRLRPTGPFSEPSYLGLVVLSFCVIGLHSVRRRWIPSFLAMILALCVLAASLYGALACLIISATYVVRGPNRDLRAPSGLIPVAALTAAVVGTGALATRVHQLLTGSDQSGITRLIRPFALIGETLATRPFGVTSTGAYQYMLERGLYSIHEDAPIHNGLLNLAIFYGLPGLAALLILLTQARTVLTGLFIALAFVQNGSVSSFDKVFLIGLVCVIVNSLNSTSGVQAPIENFGPRRGGQAR